MIETTNNRIFEIEDFVDSRAKAIAGTGRLHPERIFPKYLELTFAILPHQGNIERYVDSKDGKEELLYALEKLASGTVVNYELTQKDTIQFPISEKSPIKDNREKRFFELVKSMNGIMCRGRNDPLESYKAAAENYSKGIGLVNKALRELEDIQS